MAWIAGVDGCKAGWIAAILDLSTNAPPILRVVPGFAELLAGNPALAIPIPVKNANVPVTSLQLVGRRFGEAQLLNAGRLVEASNPLTE